MKKIKMLQVTFDATLEPYEIPAFRGAIASKVPIDSVLFHNHGAEGLRYSYPLIQYKRNNKYASIVCLGEGVDQIHHFFENKDWTINISGKKLAMKIDDLKMHNHTVKIDHALNRYKIRNWMPLGDKAFKEFVHLEDEAGRLEKLESKLVGNILSFAKGMNWHIDKNVICRIKEINNQKNVSFKGMKMITFDLEFSTNVSLPVGIGLGRKVGFGHGVLSKSH